MVNITKFIIDNLEIQEINHFDYDENNNSVHKGTCILDGLIIDKYEMSIELNIEITYNNKDDYNDFYIELFEVWLFEDGVEVACKYDFDKIEKHIKYLSMNC